MKFINFLKSLLFAAPKIEQKIEATVNSIVEIPDVVAEAIAEQAVSKPKKKRVYKKKK
jgi:hypothetical protein